jgi:Poly(R)-hydroxyalkanoic acid synthase subunit (PHA_synth_III_E)
MSDNLASLYAGWTQAVPDAFRMLMPSTASAAMAAAPSSSATAPARAAAPFPVEQIGAALGIFEGILTQLYQSYLPLLAQDRVTTEPFEALAQTATKAFDAMLLSLQQAPAGLPPLAAWPALSANAVPGAAQLQLGIERTFGGLGEAFGLGPLRQLQEAWHEMLLASVAKQRAQVEYLALAAQAFASGTATLMRELQAMARRGERVESLLGFIRMWAKAVDAPLHDAMQGGAGLDATAKVIRASTAHRQQVQKVVAIASTTLHMPTRDDMSEAFREIQALKRELRRLKRALPAAARKKLVPHKERAA